MKHSTFYLFIICILVCSGLHAQTVSLDNTFGVNGTKTTSFQTSALANCLVIQPNGNIIMAGSANNDFALARYTKDGKPDNSFGNKGSLTTDFNSGGDDFANAIALRKDGKIIVAGYTNKDLNTDFAIACYHSDGSLDNSFGMEGKVIVDFGNGTDQATAIAIQPDNKMVVAGFSWNGHDNDFSLTRYSANGIRDISFGDNGRVVTDFGSSMEYIYSLIIKPNGKILVSGFSNQNGNSDFAVAQYNLDGTQDIMFGNGGVSLADFGSNFDHAYSMQLQPDGKIIVAGSTGVGPYSKFAMVRFLEDGGLDYEFADGGLLTDHIGSASNYATSVSMQLDGKIILAGFAYNGNSNDFAMARYTPNGTIDHSFNLNGKLVSPIGKSEDVAYSVGVQPDGKILLAGFSTNNATNEFTLSRFTTTTNDINIVDDTKVRETVNLNKNNTMNSSNKIGEKTISEEMISFEAQTLISTYSETDTKIENDANFGNVEIAFLKNSVVLYPNPIQQSAALKYSLSNHEIITIKISDMHGRLIQTVVDGENQIPGLYIQAIELPYDMASGNYYVTISSPNGKATVKFIKTKG